jgi:hypothetical protein
LIDDGLRELLSRFIDGDLDPDEEARLAERLDGDPGLAAELEGMRTLRQSVRRVAATMEPPAALDAVVEPLRQSPPLPPRRVRPVYRWLGAAAAVVLGVTVAMEVAQRNPGPTPASEEPERHRRVVAEEEIFELAPLPTADPEENRPIGAVERLLDEEPSPPPSPEMAPLEVIGPTSTDVGGDAPLRSEKAAARADLAESVAEPQVASQPAALTTARDADIGSSAGREAGKGGAVEDKKRETEDDMVVGKVSVGAQAMNKARPAPEELDLERTAPTVRLVVAGTEVWSGAVRNCPEGRWPLRVEVRDGVVVSTERGSSERSEESSSLCIPEDLLGATVRGVEDGWHAADLVVTASNP